MRGKITKRAVDALRSSDDGAEAMLWDTELKGFGCRVQRGGGKTYVLQYRAGTGRDAPLRKLTIGRHGSPWTPETARSEAKTTARHDRGAAPTRRPTRSRARQRRRSPNSRNASLPSMPRRSARLSTAAEYRRLLDKIILPAFGKRKVADVTRADIDQASPRQPGGAVSGEPRARGALQDVQSRRAVGLAAGRIEPLPPCREVRRAASASACCRPAELARLGDALAAYDGSPYAVAAVKLLVFTGARLGEVLGLKWEWIDFERGEARLPDSKTGAKTLHLPPPALAVLAELPRLDGNPLCDRRREGGRRARQPRKAVAGDSRDGRA